MTLEGAKQSKVEEFLQSKKFEQAPGAAGYQPSMS